MGHLTYLLGSVVTACLCNPVVQQGRHSVVSASARPNGEAPALVLLPCCPHTEQTSSVESELGLWRLPSLGIANVSVIKHPKNCVLVTGNFLFGCNFIISYFFNL